MTNVYYEIAQAEGFEALEDYDVMPVLRALAEPTRRCVVELLSERPHNPGELASATGCSPQAMSRHLRVLSAAGVVESKSGAGDARIRLYWLRPEPMKVLRTWVDYLEAHWNQQRDDYRNRLGN